MSKFIILMYEDEQPWKEAFEYSIKARVEKKGKELEIIPRLDGDTIEADIAMYSPNLIMVDHDLGTLTGDEIITEIDGNPEFIKTSIFYYSGGESIDDLKKRAEKFNCQIRCFTKEGDDLDNAVVDLA